MIEPVNRIRALLSAQTTRAGFEEQRLTDYRRHQLRLIRKYWSDDAIYSLSDGYGTPGYVPPHGHDWSGVRDSSDEAIDRMYQVAKRLASNEG